MAIVSLKKIEKVYPNGFKAVHGIDLDIRDGEFMVFVGPSGCSKSTLLRMVAGLESITGGEIHIGKKIVNNLLPKQRGIAMVFQNYALYPHMNVRQNLGFGLKLAGIKGKELTERVDRAAKMLEIEHLMERYPKQLSGGQAQRVAVGRAIVKKPDVFLFDEPLSNLDAKLRASMRVRITELHRQLKEGGQPCTSIYVTHDQVEAMTMGERICVLRDGRIQQVDTPSSLYDRPANTFVASFIGSPEMNIRDVELTQSKSGVALLIGGKTLPLPAAHASRLKAHNAKKVKLGIRPEGITVDGAESGGDLAWIEGKLRFMENMGSEVFVHFDVADVPFTSRIPANKLGDLAGKGRGDIQRFGFQMQRCHVFDAESGNNLTL
jgi:oligogalacturonide transport system ATP-binding protein